MAAGDQMVPPGHAQELCRIIPRARHLELTGGHLAPMESPAFLAGVIQAFLDE